MDFNDRLHQAYAGRQTIKLNGVYFMKVANEWRTWREYYLKGFSVSGKTVLDVGAGCGETVFLFLLAGAKKVIAIDNNIEAVECLRENVAKNNWNVEVIRDVFRLKYLDIEHDFMKMDIEGDEYEILHASLKKPNIVEVHGNRLIARFKKVGWKKVFEESKDLCLMSRFIFA